MNKKILISVIILICSFGAIILGNMILTSDTPKYTIIEENGAHANHYKLGEEIKLDEQSIIIHSIGELDDANDAVLQTNLDANEALVFNSYYSIFYGSNDMLERKSGVRLKNDEMILNCKEQNEYTQLIILENGSSKIIAVVNLQ